MAGKTTARTLTTGELGQAIGTIKARLKDKTFRGNVMTAGEKKERARLRRNLKAFESELASRKGKKAAKKTAKKTPAGGRKKTSGASAG
jgi:hypothetical protein